MKLYKRLNVYNLESLLFGVSGRILSVFVLICDILFICLILGGKNHGFPYGEENKEKEEKMG